jgi:hypothetical protein
LPGEKEEDGKMQQHNLCKERARLENYFRVYNGENWTRFRTVKPPHDPQGGEAAEDRLESVVHLSADEWIESYCAPPPDDGTFRSRTCNPALPDWLVESRERIGSQRRREADEGSSTPIDAEVDGTSAPRGAEVSSAPGEAAR